jgi:Rps23 Pro-64 3,4-dihydroxylase Tpa1-like proline 4-hydroxylase
MESPLTNLTIETFLPTERMREVLPSAHESYISAKPFPHVAIDNFLDSQMLDSVLSEFPKPGQIHWQQFDNAREIKLASAKESNFGPITRLLFYHLNSITFLDFLSGVTGIQHLVPDPSLDGGGLHQIVRGGKLGIHADFNKHPRYGLDRRLNVIIYLNKHWQEDYGGHLELWDRSMSRCEAKISPVFNRMVIFGTTDFTYHGHPDALQCPAEMTRKSMALYYFSNGRPADEISGDHTTIFRDRHAGEYKLTMRQRIRSFARDIVPPIIARQFRRSDH